METRAAVGRASATTTTRGDFRIDGVTGPDEYSALVDNNVYTNLMAQLNLRVGASSRRAPPPRRRERLGVDDDEAAELAARGRRHVRALRRAGAASTRRTRTSSSHSRWDFEDTPPEHYPLLLHYPYFQLYRKQVVKQADLVLAMHWRGDAFTAEQKRANFDYYERLTVRDSSLSACTQAVLAAEVGHLDAGPRLPRARRRSMDLARPAAQHGATACTWPRWPARCWRPSPASAGCATTAAGSFRPRLPEGIDRLRFSHRDPRQLLRVEMGHGRDGVLALGQGAGCAPPTGTRR